MHPDSQTNNERSAGQISDPAAQEEEYSFPTAFTLNGSPEQWKDIIDSYRTRGVAPGCRERRCTDKEV